MNGKIDIAPRKLRPLGLLERYSTVRSHLGIYNNVCVTAVYRCSYDGDLLQALWRAVGDVVAQHPILSATPVDIDTKDPRFISLPITEPEQVIQLRKSQTVVTDPHFEAELQMTLEKQHNTPFEHGATPKPFWRLEVLDDRTNSGSFVTCLCFHHSLMDTKSALIFHEDLEKALNQSSITTHSKDALLPSLEAVYDLPVSEAFVQQASIYNESPANVWSGAVQKLPVRTRVRLFWVSGEVADSFRKHCKGQKASVTAGMMALLAAAFFKVLPDDYDTLQGDCAISLRHLLPVPISDRSLGCYVGSFSEQYSRSADPASVWSDARRTKSTIDEVTKRRGADMPVGYLRHVADDMPGWLSGKLGKKRAAAWELSNVGVVGYAGKVTETEFKVERMLFSQSASATSGAVKVSVVTGRDGQLGFAFSWQEGIVEERLAEEVVSTFRELLLALISEGGR
ncbi:putative alcohol acetyltransferase FCK4 [Colletotrichum fructicola]|nr:putative alcohol acetyltransferase FCK4 [Colletotrichum fructicola]